MNYFDLIKQYSLNEVKEQKDFLTNSEFITPKKPLVLAGGTGFGKTFTTILKLIMFYMDPKNKGKKTIILPSSTKVLRNNFAESMDMFNGLPFCYKIATGKRDFKRYMNHSDCDVIIVLPQTLANIKELPKVEWLVVDEAHKWYFAKTIEGIIERCNPTYQLLLTGTPFKFNARKDDYLMFYVPIEDMMEAGNVGNPLIEVVSSSINLKDDEYTNDNQPITTIRWSYKEDKNQLITVAKEINKTLKTRFRKSTIGRMLGVFGIDKTIIYCYSKKQARHFYKAFQSSDLKGKVLLSDSESDIDSTEFNKFKTEEEYRVLLVVDRGKEGFDMPELFNIVDFTLSVNPEIILQILGRVLRISKEQPNKQKIYYKVASMNTAPFILTLMTGVLQLANKEYYASFTGKFDEIKIPMMPTKKRNKVVNPGKNKNNFSTRALQYFQEANIPLTANFWNQLSFKQGDIWKTMGQTTLKQVLAESRGTRGKGFVTKEMCIESARKYNTLKEWRESPDQYHSQVANQMGWLNEIIEITGIKRENEEWTVEKMFDLAKQSKVKRWSHFLSENSSVSAAAYRLGIYDDLKALFPTGRKSKYDDYTEEQLLAIPKKYNIISNMIRENQTYWNWMKKKGREDEVRSMFNSKNNFTLQTKIKREGI